MNTTTNTPNTKPTMFAIKKKSYCGWEHEGEYPTREEAQAVLDTMRLNAEKRTAERAEWLAAHPKPWDDAARHKAFIEGYDSTSTPIDDFNERGWYVAEIEPTDTVYRLNTLPKDSPALVKEIETKMSIFGNCTLSWTCTGHTRSEWQSEEAAAQLKALHPEWEIFCTGYSVSMRVAA